MLIGPIMLLVVVPALRMIFLGSEDEPAAMRAALRRRSDPCWKAVDLERR
jgi:hypothetical protein